MSAAPVPSLPVRQGIKMALAGMLGFYAALALNLPDPTWCIFTVVVLTMAQYVGAIAEKALLRAVGTVVGAALGILLVGNFASEPIVMILGAFALTALGATFFGGNWYPYAFFLGGLTALIVIGATMEAPQNAWTVGTARIQEICLGILVSTAVTSVIWPRYARDEFRHAFREALRDAGDLAIARSRRLLDRVECTPEVARTEQRFATRMNQLRLLLRYGGRESEYFRLRLPIRMRMVGELGGLFEAAQSLGQRLPEHSRYRALISEELRALHAEIEAEVRALATAEGDLGPEAERLASAVAAVDTRLLAIRAEGLTRDVPIEEALDFSSHYAALLDIAERLRSLRRGLHEIHATSEVITPRISGGPGALHVSAFWVRNGIKAGLTAAAALLYVNWANPPGGSVIPFAAWLLTATSRLYPGGEGDRRAFSYALKVAVAGLPYVLLLFLLTPFLANYLWMNLFLAAGLFALGFAITRDGGISLYTQCGMLFFIGGVGLNPQEPVAYEAVVNVYFGVVLALVLSAFIQRLLWPLLPQREIFALFAEFFACCRRLLGRVDAATLASTSERMTLISPELAAWIRVATTPEFPAGERERLGALLGTVERLGYGIVAARKVDTYDAPEEVRAAVRERLDALESRGKAALEELETIFRRVAPLPSDDAVANTFAPLEREISELRQRYLCGALPFPAAIPYFGALNFFSESAAMIDRCAEQVRQLRLERYRDDNAL